MRVILIKSIVVVFIGFLLVFTFVSSLSGQTCISISPGIEQTFRTLLPEGWSFFTRNPREDMVTIYKVVNNTPIRVSSLNSETDNLCGLSRKSRKLGYDVSTMLSTLPKNNWVKTNSLNKLEIKKQNFNKVNKKNLQINTLDKGQYMIVTQPTIPWAWSKYPSRVNKEYTVCFTEII
ncbi:MAG: SdpA family antimicrobial peptide system protein [Chryseobacterium sp.]|uniref:SdpA family antimicrobial peptide system protein n=1 Tax=Chryseobacterium sp. TaxID=1871047 RepID=UPI0025BD5066|nr:SdpA family antimicrobial peptide system protein [Chryseobacterium sp.]MCJ7934114.1 SdpA family antimicrobial peptide system protein [Chryseobacterium sp.]